MSVDTKIIDFCRERKQGCFSVNRNKDNDCTLIEMAISSEIPLEEQLQLFENIYEGTKNILIFNNKRLYK